MKMITLVIPAKNEKESLGEVLKEALHYNVVKEIIVVVDSLEDNSIKIAEEYNCKVIIQKNSGYGSALIEGFRESTNKYACIFNADFSMDPKYLQSMIDKTNENDFIFGTRYKNGSSDDDNFITLFGNKVFSLMSRLLLGIKLTDILYTYVLCDVKKFNTLNFKKKDFRLCIELPFLVNLNSYSYDEIGMHERKRYNGEKNVNVIIDGFLILIEIMNSFLKRIFRKDK